MGVALLVPTIARFASLLGVDQSILLLAPRLVLLDGVDPVLREVSGGDGADAPERRALGNALGLELRVLGGEVGVEGDLIGGQGGVHHAANYDPFVLNCKHEVKKRGRSHHAPPSPNEHPNPKS